MKNIWVFLDDKRETPLIVHNNKRGLGIDFAKSNQWIFAKNYQEFVDIIISNFDLIDFISFDHDISSYDLNDNELTGKDAANFLIEYCIDNNKKLPNWFVHSDNSGGNKNIRNLLSNYMYRFEKRLDDNKDIYGYIDGNLFYKI